MLLPGFGLRSGFGFPKSDLGSLPQGSYWLYTARDPQPPGVFVEVLGFRVKFFLKKGPFPTAEGV